MTGQAACPARRDGCSLAVSMGAAAAMTLEQVQPASGASPWTGSSIQAARWSSSAARAQGAVSWSRSWAHWNARNTGGSPRGVSRRAGPRSEPAGELLKDEPGETSRSFSFPDRNFGPGADHGRYVQREPGPVSSISLRDGRGGKARVRGTLARSPVPRTAVRSAGDWQRQVVRSRKGEAFPGAVSVLRSGHCVAVAVRG